MTPTASTNKQRLQLAGIYFLIIGLEAVVNIVVVRYWGMLSWWDPLRQWIGNDCGQFCLQFVYLFLMGNIAPLAAGLAVMAFAISHRYQFASVLFFATIAIAILYLVHGWYLQILYLCLVSLVLPIAIGWLITRRKAYSKPT